MVELSWPEGETADKTSARQFVKTWIEGETVGKVDKVEEKLLESMTNQFFVPFPSAALACFPLGVDQLFKEGVHPSEMPSQGDIQKERRKTLASRASKRPKLEEHENTVESWVRLWLHTQSSACENLVPSRVLISSRPRMP